ncbi:TIGR02647 family protein [Halomonas campisalis]|uniref:TIGR02647 family protein n=1 Tax=Billgrantia campisalis TaxID=74661 RepID=A0ABS9PA77_9GAMM|nr:TIGR02647 family protein [Halomonas campisalis]MCG6658673.1 TIGR02647 family protein [Halomonas campisalis]MDR5864061.1 TIGR02647 family protein [Halomonas campisalis]
MPQSRFTPEQLDELNLLCLFNPDSTQEGLKVHTGTAAPEAVAAVARLHAKGLVTQADGGYLTTLGREAAVHTQALRGILDPVELTT